MGPGTVPAEVYQFAGRVAAALCAGNSGASVLSAMNTVFLEGYLDALEQINPRNYRLGGGREEPDGSFSFLVRFIGREQGITGELYIRYLEPEAEDTEPEQTTGRIWVFEDLILEEARDRETENRETRHRFDFSPYERFF